MITIHRDILSHPMHQYVHGAYERRYSCTGCGLHVIQYGANWPVKTRAPGQADWVDTYRANFPPCTAKGGKLLESARQSWDKGLIARLPDGSNLPYGF